MTLGTKKIISNVINQILSQFSKEIGRPNIIRLVRKNYPCLRLGINAFVVEFVEINVIFCLTWLRGFFFIRINCRVVNNSSNDPDFGSVILFRAKLFRTFANIVYFYALCRKQNITKHRFIYGGCIERDIELNIY